MGARSASAHARGAAAVALPPEPAATDITTVRLEPLSDWLVVRIEPEPPALVIPGVERIDLPKVACVKAAGPGYVAQDGTLVPNPVHVGDYILLQIGAGKDVKLGDEIFRLVQARDLFGIFRMDAAI